jgi:uncharacterized damage-inducible protein DinB
MSAAENPWLKMAQNNAWSNATLYKVMNRLPRNAFIAARPGFFPSLSKTMNHIYEVDLYYLDALEQGGRGRTVYDRADVNEPGELAALQAATDLRFAAFCDAITPETLIAPRRTLRSDGECEETVAALVLHLVQHQIHHRGQAHVQLQDARVSPPQLDDFYLEFGRVPSAQVYW